VLQTNEGKTMKEERAMTLKNITLNGKPLQFCSACGRMKAPGLCPCLIPPKSKRRVIAENDMRKFA